MTNAIDKITNETTRRFAEATYDDYFGNASEIPTEADETDMKQWGITSAQWMEAVNAARKDIEADAE